MDKHTSLDKNTRAYYGVRTLQIRNVFIAKAPGKHIHPSLTSKSGRFPHFTINETFANVNHINPTVWTGALLKGKAQYS